MLRRFAAFFLTAIILAGCSSMKPEDFAGREPKLVLEEYFLGKTKAWGIFEDRFGTLRRSFTVDITGTWDEEQQLLTLEEDFLYDDGEVDRRVWRVTKKDEHNYNGRADDVVGVAEGKIYGPALNWKYDIDLKMKDSSLRVTFNDWMFLQDEETMINRAKVTKFGILLGEVTIFFRKQEVEETAMNAAEKLVKQASAAE
ncbi:MAG: DUF3833 domain-containing protein [Limibacillus sp.]|jgi:hypothetical protein